MQFMRTGHNLSSCCRILGFSGVQDPLEAQGTGAAGMGWKWAEPAFLSLLAVGRALLLSLMSSFTVSLQSTERFQNC